MWNHALRPASLPSPVAVREASGGQRPPEATRDDVVQPDCNRVNPVTGRVAHLAAEPGDALVLALDVHTWGWTASTPGFGLLAEDFPEPLLRISRTTDRYAERLPGLGGPLGPWHQGQSPRHPGSPARAAGGRP